MKQFYRLAALFLVLLLLCGCAAGNGYGKPERKEGQDQYLTDSVPEGKPQPVEPQDVTVSPCSLRYRMIFNPIWM